MHVAASIHTVISAALACTLLTSCIRFSNTYSVVPPGIWRATLVLSTDTADIAEERSGGLLPFNFEIRYYTTDSFEMVIHNAEERIVCRDIHYGRDALTGRDTVRIYLPVFNTYITAECEEDAIEGFWWDPSRSAQYRIPFKAYHGRDYRFKSDAGTQFRDIEGRWKAAIGVESASPEEAILVVDQNERQITGTFLTETGDYRYLEGIVEDDRMYLSTFDGSHAYLFEAKLGTDGTLSGIYRSGNHYKTYWTASPDDTTRLADPYTLTSARTDVPFVFSFPNTEGDTISSDDPRYEGKPKIVTIFGTWCPNCMDENTFLSDFFRQHPELNIEVISIAFERHKEKDKAIEAIRKYRSHFDIDWEILYGGSSNKQFVASQFPMLDNFISFPTMIFLDSENRVVKIHTGFYGPATEKYESFKSEFEETVQMLTRNSVPAQ